jgi:hypothetical protein
MPIPLIAYLAAAGVGAYLILRKKEPSSASSSEGAVPPPASLPEFASAMNERTQAIQAQTAALRAQGIKPAGQGPRTVDASALLVARNGIVFSTSSPAGFLGSVSRDTMGNRLEPGDLVTVDVATAGIQVPEVPSGNMPFRVVGSAPMGPTNIDLVTLDPRLPATTAVVSIPQAAITDVMAGDGAGGSPLPADMGSSVLGMAQ